MRIHLAGNVGSKMHAAILTGHPWHLISYFYCQGKDGIEEHLSKIPGYIMDSGLYSFMFGAEKGTIPETLEAYLDYTKRYLDDVDRWGYQGIVVESDVHKLLGMDAVFRLREEFEPLGDRVMYVWHLPEGLDGLIELAKKQSYIAISVPELRMLATGTTLGSAKKIIGMVRDLLRRVHSACGSSPPRIHLLGCTVQELINTRFAWSCDSTSWLYGVQYGEAFMFVDGKLKGIRVNSQRFIKYRDNAVAANDDVCRLISDLPESKRKYVADCFGVAFAYSEYQKWLDKTINNVPMRGGELQGRPYVER